MDLSTLANLINAFAVTAALFLRPRKLVITAGGGGATRCSSLSVLSRAQRFQERYAASWNCRTTRAQRKSGKLLGTEGEDLLVHLAATWETIGVLLFHGELTLDIIDDFFSGPILISWRKLLPYTTDQRQRYQRDTWWEWFQWLAERMTERESKTPAVPAYIAHRDWKKL